MENHAHYSQSNNDLPPLVHVIIYTGRNREMKKIIIVLVTLLLMCGCSFNPVEDNEVVDTGDPVSTVNVETVEPAVNADTAKLPLTSIGIFNDIEDPSLYCVVEMIAYQNDDDFTSIDFDPFYNFSDKHTTDGTLERYSYYDYDNPDDTVFTTMGFTPQSTYDYNISYYIHFYKLDDRIKDDFLNVLHNLKAKYGTRIEEGDSVEITYFEGQDSFVETDDSIYDFEELPLDHNADGYNYYLIDAENNLYLKVKDDLDDIFMAGKRNSLYGVYFQGDVMKECITGWYISDTVYTHHWESGGWSYAQEQLTENLRIAQHINVGGVHSSDPDIQEKLDNFDYNTVALEILE